MSEDQIPTADVELLPVCSILPFTKDEDVPPEFAVMDGRVITYRDAPEFVLRMHERWTAHSKLPIHKAAVEFWERYGGSVNQSFIRLPTIPPEEVTQLAFGVTYLPEDVKPVLAIKVWRSE